MNQDENGNSSAIEYLFFLEGLDREVWQVGPSEGAARTSVWNALTDQERNRVAQIECIDERSFQRSETAQGQTREDVQKVGTTGLVKHNDRRRNCNERLTLDSFIEGVPCTLHTIENGDAGLCDVDYSSISDDFAEILVSSAMGAASDEGYAVDETNALECIREEARGYGRFLTDADIKPLVPRVIASFQSESQSMRVRGDLRRLHDLLKSWSVHLSAERTSPRIIVARQILIEKIKECKGTTVYQPHADHMPDDLMSSDVFLSLGEGVARYPEVPEKAWLALQLSDIENADIVDFM